MFLLTISLGVWKLLMSDDLLQGNFIRENTIIAQQDWIYTTDKSETPISTSLPAKLVLPRDALKLTLEGKLPETSISGGMLRFCVSSQTADIYIDGKHRHSYGSLDVSLYDYPYVSAAHYIMMELEPTDYGKEIRIALQAPPMFAAELSLVRAVEVGSHSDFLERDMIHNSSSILVSALALAFIVALLCVAAAMWLYKKPAGFLLIFALYTLLWVLFFNSDNSLLWELFDSSPRYSAFNDWKFYTMDSFMPLASYLVLLSCVPVVLKRWQKSLLVVHISIYGLAAILHMLSLLSINYFRPLLMLISFVMYMSLFIGMRKQLRTLEKRYFAISVFVLMAGYFIDYIKYASSLIPMSSDVTLFVQLKLPFMFFLGISIIIYSLLLLFGIVELFQRESVKLQHEVDLTAMQLRMNKSQYDTMMHNYEFLRMVRHDMQHHFRALDSFAVKQEYEQLSGYLRSLMVDVEKIHLSNWCHSHVGNSTIGWFADEANRKGIRFTCQADIPAEMDRASIDLCIVLSNALQNALEACDRMETGERYISLNAYPAGNALVLHVENSYEGELNEINGQLQTVKTVQGHGIGLSSIRAAVERSDGFIRIQHNENTFVLDLVLNNVLPV